MLCQGCGNPVAYRISFSSASITKEGLKSETCDQCKPQKGFKFSDVYFRKPYFDPQIAHPDHSPNGTFIESREHKASLMRQLGIREAS